MQFKKVISSVLVVILLLSLTVFSASAADAKAFELAVDVKSAADAGEKTYVNAGETIEVSIIIPENKNPGVAVLTFDVLYDNTALTLKVEEITTSIFTMGSPSISRPGIIVDEQNGRVGFISDTTNSNNIVATGTIATLVFTAKNVCADAEIAVKNVKAINAANNAVATVENEATVVTIHDVPTTGTKVGATCTEAGYTEYKCTKCDFKYTEEDESAPALGHDMSEATCTEDSACTRCGAKGADKATGHKFSAWAVEKEAEKGVDGAKVRTCSNCGEKETEVIPALAGGSFPVVAIVIIVVFAVAAAGFCVYWFVLRKK